MTIEQYLVYESQRSIAYQWVKRSFKPTSKLNKSFPAWRLAEIATAAMDLEIPASAIVAAAHRIGIETGKLVETGETLLAVSSNDVRKAMAKAGITIDLVDASAK